MTLPSTLNGALALASAGFNAVAAVLLTLAYVAIRQRRVSRHRFLMLSAFAASCLFLTAYLARHALGGEVPFQGQGWIRPVYFTILITHVTLAVCVVPLALRTLYLGLKRRFVPHRRIARITLPIWMYVSVTGVVVYFMLFQMPALG